MNYFEFYPGDYLRDTAHLSMAEHGSYLLLLSFYYSTERPLPADNESLFRIARALNKSEQGSVIAVADQFFPIGEDGLRHSDRTDKEIEKAQKRINAARENGKGGGRPKKPSGKPKPNPAETQEKPTGFHSANPVANPMANPAETHPGEALHAPHAIPQNIPTSSGEEPPDPFFGTGLSFLTRKGVKPTNARSFIGMLRKKVGDLNAAALLAKADEEDITNPLAWLSAAVNARASPKPAMGKTAQAMHTLEGMKNGNKRPDSGTHATATLLEFRGSASGGADSGNGAGLVRAVGDD